MSEPIIKATVRFTIEAELHPVEMNDTFNKVWEVCSQKLRDYMSDFGSDGIVLIKISDPDLTCTVVES